MDEIDSQFSTLFFFLFTFFLPPRYTLVPFCPPSPLLYQNEKKNLIIDHCGYSFHCGSSCGRDLWEGNVKKDARWFAVRVGEDGSGWVSKGKRWKGFSKSCLC